MIAFYRHRKAAALPEIRCSSPSLQSDASNSTRWSWTTQSSDEEPAEKLDPPPSPVDEDEYDRINKARERLALRDSELRQTIRHCNKEMDIVRRKLCKDLEVLEILKGEVDKVGAGPMREQLEVDFYNEYLAYVSTLVKQKDTVEEMQEMRKAAMRHLEAIAWSDQVLEQRAERCKRRHMQEAENMDARTLPIVSL